MNEAKFLQPRSLCAELVVWRSDYSTQLLGCADNLQVGRMKKLRQTVGQLNRHRYRHAHVHYLLRAVNQPD